MDIYSNKVRDLVLNPEFRKWVLYPNAELNKTWRNYLAKNPTSAQDVEVARELILELFSNQYPLQDREYREIWSKIETETTNEDQIKQHAKVVPIRQGITSKRPTKDQSSFQFGYLSRIASILLISMGFGIFAHMLTKPDPIEEVAQPEKYVMFRNPPGVKSSITLGDGTRVMLNAGSNLSYEENKFKEVREVFLEGEAFFEVVPDPERPFTVNAGGVHATALGTTFNIMAYKEEKQQISLHTGKVSIEVPNTEIEKIFLSPREAIRISPDRRVVSKAKFDEETILAWTKKTIVFEDTSLAEAIRTLENWYGVKFNFQNRPKPGMHLSGRFHNETLENVMEGLRYTAGLDFNIENDRVNIKFNY